MAEEDLNRLTAGRDKSRSSRARSGSSRSSSQSRPPADDSQALNNEAPGAGYRAGPDLDRMPNNYDPDVWRLARAFMAAAEKYGVELDVSIYRTYALLFRRISKTKLRERKNWVAVVELMITEFWEHDVETDGEAWAINDFVGVETFKGLASWALRSQAKEPEWRIERAEGAQELGERRRAARKARQVQEFEDDDEMRELRARARARIDAAMKEFAE